jgi:ABC-type phosphate/phosphonate transport system substrate-binding protein
MVRNRLLGSLALSGFAIVASLLLSSSGFASNSRAQHPATHSAGNSVHVIEAGGQDFSSEDVEYWLDLMERKGIDVKFDLIEDASTALRTLISGQADVWIGNFTTPIAAVVNAGAPIHIIAANDQASDYVILGQSGLTLQNLGGTTMGQDAPGSSGVVAAQIALQRSNVDPNTVKYVTVGGSSARLTAILAGKIDLAPVHYPLALKGLSAGKGLQVVVNTGKLLGPYIQTSLVANDNFIKDKVLAQKVVNYFINAERWAASNKYKYIADAAKRGIDGGLTGPEMASTWDFFKDVNFWGINGGICNKNVTSTIKLNWQIGTLPKPIPVGRDKLIDREFVVNYLKAHHQKPTVC